MQSGRNRSIVHRGHAATTLTLAAVLVRRFGGPKGMLILSDYAPVVGRIDEIVQAGFGCSIMSAPAAAEAYAREEFVELLADWGWTGDESERPDWLDSVDPDASL